MVDLRSLSIVVYGTIRALQHTGRLQEADGVSASLHPPQPGCRLQ